MANNPITEMNSADAPRKTSTVKLAKPVITVVAMDKMDNTSSASEENSVSDSHSRRQFLALDRSAMIINRTENTSPTMAVIKKTELIAGAYPP